jgi:hypothetical protein
MAISEDPDTVYRCCSNWNTLPGVIKCNKIMRSNLRQDKYFLASGLLGNSLANRRIEKSFLGSIKLFPCPFNL